MAFSKEYLDSLTSKDSVIEYAASFGIDGLVKQKSLKNLKKDVAYQIEETIKPSDDLMANLLSESSIGFSEVSNTVTGEKKLVIKHYNETIATINPNSLELWCENNSQDYSIVKNMVGLPWLNHLHYSYALED